MRVDVHLLGKFDLHVSCDSQRALCDICMDAKWCSRAHLELDELRAAGHVALRGEAAVRPHLDRDAAGVWCKPCQHCKARGKDVLMSSSSGIRGIAAVENEAGSEDCEERQYCRSIKGR